MAEIGGATFSFGFGNFVKVIEYKNFLSALKNTVLLCLITVPISTILVPIYPPIISNDLSFYA